MKLRLDQLNGHLQQQLAPIYWVSGDVPLLVQETCDAIRAAAKQQGFSERELLHVESGFDWNYVLESASSLSLFGDKKIMELRMPSGKPTDAGKKVLGEYAGNPAPDTLLLIVTNKLDAQTQRTKWFKTIEAAATWIPIWPIEGQQLPQWIHNRMQAAGLQPSRDAVQLLAERVEGNLLAASQEVEKLRLLCGEGPIDVEQVKTAVADSARYDVFSLVDTALAGQTEKSLKILTGLKAEGTEPIAVLWALTRELRTLKRMRAGLDQGLAPAKLMQDFRIFHNRKNAVQQGLKRLRTPQLLQMLQLAGRIDRSIKGMDPGAPWNGLTSLVYQLSGGPDTSVLRSF